MEVVECGVPRVQVVELAGRLVLWVVECGVLRVQLEDNGVELVLVWVWVELELV
jgi:hypothetical protein